MKFEYTNTKPEMNNERGKYTGIVKDFISRDNKYVVFHTDDTKEYRSVAYAVTQYLKRNNLLDKIGIKRNPKDKVICLEKIG